MSTITVTLRDDDLLQIRKLAQGSGTTPEEWLRTSIEAVLANPRSDFEQASAYVLEKNADLYRRLA